MESGIITLLILVLGVIIFVNYERRKEGLVPLTGGYDGCIPIDLPCMPSGLPPSVPSRVKQLSDPKTYKMKDRMKTFKDLERVCHWESSADSKSLDQFSNESLYFDQCVKPKSRQQFNDEFFSFRDKIYDSNDQRVDPVDKFYSMKFPKGMKIKDIYDELVKNPYQDNMKHYKPKEMELNYGLNPIGEQYDLLKLP